MKRTIIFIAIISVFLGSIFAPLPLAAQSPNSQSLNGSTGLYSIPTGRIGWETSNLGLDFGYRAVINNDMDTSHIPALTVSLLKIFELSAAFDIQPDIWYFEDQGNHDLLFGLKIMIPTKGNTSIAVGCSLQLINVSNEHDFDYNAYQPYVAFTYPGSFFKMPAETTVVFGKTFYSGGPDNNSNIDFGMGFDLILFPDALGKAVHLIIDFANFSYSDNSWPNTSFYHSGPAWYRGVLNTGFRIDLSTIPQLSKVKFVIDFIFNDLFDAGQRSFTVGAVFGVNVM
jgi:hypothetical protein